MNVVERELFRVSQAGDADQVKAVLLASPDVDLNWRNEEEVRAR